MTRQSEKFSRKYFKNLPLYSLLQGNLGSSGKFLRYLCLHVSCTSVIEHCFFLKISYNIFDFSVSYFKYAISQRIRLLSTA